MSPRDRVTAELWDVRWGGDGFGKHGNGPFATEGQARKCLAAVGWSGTVERCICTMDRASLERILRKGNPR